MTKAEREAKKNLQIIQNKVIENMCDVALKVWNENPHGKGKRLDSMQARIFEIDGIKFLQSYETLAAFIVDDIGYDILRMFTFKKTMQKGFGFCRWEETEYTNYSPTSGRQISRFFDKYNLEKILTYREV